MTAIVIPTSSRWPGWYSQVDEDVCKAFQSEKGLPSTGTVDEPTWRAAWTAPVT
ncbi:hypothetical protein ABZ297_28590 [Nonomuraea sp. NPDC005983]|uniref:peptidoglycan-binding domain-containing protein n=1 Tax=Nonomuraea sp. NPDC005983 TaxID=3155595 RepID=UPI0033B3AAE2